MRVIMRDRVISTRAHDLPPPDAESSPLSRLISSTTESGRPRIAAPNAPSLSFVCSIVRRITGFSSNLGFNSERYANCSRSVVSVNTSQPARAVRANNAYTTRGLTSKSLQSAFLICWSCVIERPIWSIRSAAALSCCRFFSSLT